MRDTTETQPMKTKIDDTLTSTDIATVQQLLQAPPEAVEYGRAVLVREKPNGKAVQHTGRVVNRSHPFVTLRQESYTVEVNLEEYEWTLRDWIPIRSPTERLLIKQEWSVESD